jgi:hypothetical protein
MELDWPDCFGTWVQLFLHGVEMINIKGYLIF